MIFATTASVTMVRDTLATTTLFHHFLSENALNTSPILVGGARSSNDSVRGRFGDERAAPSYAGASSSTVTVETEMPRPRRCRLDDVGEKGRASIELALKRSGETFVEGESLAASLSDSPASDAASSVMEGRSWWLLEILPLRETEGA